MIKFYSLFTLLISVSYINCENKCVAQTKHYEELDCKPIIENGESCPTRYECPSLDSLDPNKCYVNGKSFAVGEEIPPKYIQNPCKPECFCDRYDDLSATIICSNVDCPYNPIPYSETPIECITQQTLTSCCNSDSICGEAEIAKLTTCTVADKTYREGEAIYPDSHPCYICICGENFDENNIEKSLHCKKINCGVNQEQHKVQKGCIPIYYGTERCCPIDWRCPDSEGSDSIVKGENRSEISGEETNTCNFGSLKLNIGDSLNKENENTDCTCTIPPLAHCIQKPRNFN